MTQRIRTVECMEPGEDISKILNQKNICSEYLKLFH